MRIEQPVATFGSRRASLEQLKEQLAALIVDTTGSLHTQIQESERRLHTEMHQGFERLDARLGMIRVRDQEISEIRERLKRLENGG